MKLPLPKLADSSSNIFPILSRACTISSAGFDVVEGKTCCPEDAEPVEFDEEDDLTTRVAGANVEELDNVGLAWTGPSLESRDPKSGSRASRSICSSLEVDTEGRGWTVGPGSDSDVDDIAGGGFLDFDIDDVAGYRLALEEAVFATFEDDEPILGLLVKRMRLVALVE